MTTVDITFGNTLSKGDEFGELTTFKLSQLYGSSFIELCEMMNHEGSDKIIHISKIEASKEITSDVDLFITEAKEELSKAKKLSKEMFPIRNRLEIIKLFAKHPKAFIYGLIKK